MNQIISKTLFLVRTAPLSQILLVLILTIPVLGHGTSSCEINGMKDNLSKCILEPCSTSERTRSVNFPDGREITVVGHNHGNRGNPGKLIEFFGARSFTEDNFNQFLDGILNQGAIAAANAEEDTAFLSGLLKSRSDAFFVGLETNNANVSEEIGLFELLKNCLSAPECNALSSAGRQKFDKVLQSVFGPPIYTFSHHPEIVRNAYLKGFESITVVESQSQIRQRANDTLLHLAKSVVSQPTRLDALLDWQQKFDLLDENYNPNVSDSAVYNDLKNDNRISPEWRDSVLVWVDLELDHLKAMVERNKVVARQMTLENRSGILFVGASHLNSIAQLLREECLKSVE